jgi:hypothetical protein
VLRRACGRLLHVDDSERLDCWREWLLHDVAPDPSTLSGHDQRLLRMLLAQVFDQVRLPELSPAEGREAVVATPAGARGAPGVVPGPGREHVSRNAAARGSTYGVPSRVHARYTRLEILAACGVGGGTHVMNWREGVYFAIPVTTSA